MATLIIDWLETGLSATQEQGVLLTAQRSCLVTGCTGSGADGKLADAMGASGMPAYGDSYPGDSNLIAHTFTLKTLGSSDPNKVRVDITYVRRGDDDGAFIFHGTSSVSESNTNSDALGNIIGLSYDYPSTYPDVSLAGKTVTYAASMIFQEPQQNLHTTGILATARIAALVSSWTGYCNSTAWQGFPAGCWMCTNVSYEPHNLAASPPTYKVTFEFQLRRKGWVETVYFRTPDGDVPSDVIYGRGYKRVVVQGYRDFNERFPDE